MKNPKIYNLALKKQSHPKTKYSEQCRSLDIIVQFPQNTHTNQILEIGSDRDDYGGNMAINSQEGKPINIFQQGNCYAQNRVSFEKLKNYSILCKKEVDAYRAKLKKIKNYGIASVLRGKASDSFLSSSRQTGTFGQLVNNSQCLTKQQLVQFYKTAKQSTQKPKKLQALTHRISKPQRNTTTNESESQTLTLPQMKSCISARIQVSSSKSTHGLPPSLNLTCLNHKKSSNKNMLQLHRKKIEELSMFALKKEKQNIMPDSWIQNLRNKGELRKIFDNKFVESIQRDPILTLKGSNKLQKQYEWLSERKNNYYKALENKGKYLNKDKDKGCDQSRIVNWYSGMATGTATGAGTGTATATLANYKNVLNSSII